MNAAKLPSFQIWRICGEAQLDQRTVRAALAGGGYESFRARVIEAATRLGIELPDTLGQTPRVRAT